MKRRNLGLLLPLMAMGALSSGCTKNVDRNEGNNVEAPEVEAIAEPDAVGSAVNESANLPTDEWVGRWNGPEGLFLDIQPSPDGRRGHYAIANQDNLDRQADYAGVAEGQTIILAGRSLNIVDECCGLGMIFVFFFLACVVAAISTRPLFDRLALIVAAPAIGVMCNILRIAATAEAAVIGGPELQKQVHDVGGWLMAPLALLMNMILLAMLGFLFPPVQKAEEEPLSLAFQLAGAERPPPGESMQIKGARK